MYKGLFFVSSNIKEIYCPNIDNTPNKIEATNNATPMIVPNPSKGTP